MSVALMLLGTMLKLTVFEPVKPLPSAGLMVTVPPVATLMFSPYSNVKSVPAASTVSPSFTSGVGLIWKPVYVWSGMAAIVAFSNEVVV